MDGLQFFIHNDPDAVRIEVAGKLGGADVETLHQAWQREAFTDEVKPVVVDITFVTGADQYGRALMIMMHRFGTQIIADSPESAAIAQPIVTEPIERALPKPTWFTKLLRFLLEDRRPVGTLPVATIRTVLLAVLIAGSSMVGHTLTGYLMQHGFTSADAATAAPGVIYRQLSAQSEFLAFMDCFRIIVGSHWQ